MLRSIRDIFSKSSRSSKILFLILVSASLSVSRLLMFPYCELECVCFTILHCYKRCVEHFYSNNNPFEICAHHIWKNEIIQICEHFPDTRCV